jgi:hypothetical protein
MAFFVQKIKKMQDKALRFVCIDFNSTFEDTLIKVNIPILKIKRMRAMAIEILISHDMSPAVLIDLIVKKTSGILFYSIFYQ